MPRKLTLISQQHEFNENLRSMGLTHATVVHAKRSGNSAERPLRTETSLHGTWGMNKGYVVLVTQDIDGCPGGEIWYGRCPENRLDITIINALCPNRDDEQIRLVIGDELIINNEHLFERIRDPYADCDGTIIPPDVDQVKFRSMMAEGDIIRHSPKDAQV